MQLSVQIQYNTSRIHRKKINWRQCHHILIKNLPCRHPLSTTRQDLWAKGHPICWERGCLVLIARVRGEGLLWRTHIIWKIVETLTSSQDYLGKQMDLETCMTCTCLQYESATEEVLGAVPFWNCDRNLEASLLYSASSCRTIPILMAFDKAV